MNAVYFNGLHINLRIRNVNLILKEALGIRLSLVEFSILPH